MRVRLNSVWLKKKTAEAMSIDDYNDRIIEKHNESVGFLKTAIFQAQSNVTDEIAKQREATTKAKFIYMRKNGLAPTDGGESSGVKLLQGEIGYDGRIS